MVNYSQDNRLPFTCLWTGLITKLLSLSSAPISNMYVRHEAILIFLQRGCELCSWNDLRWWIQTIYKTPHNTPSLNPQNYSTKSSSAIGDPPRLLVSIFPQFIFGQQVSNHNLITHQCGCQSYATWVSALITNTRTNNGGNGWSKS